MTIRKHTFEGVTVGANVSGTESGSGDSFGFLLTNSGSTIVGDDAHVMHGTKAAKVNPASGGQAYFAWNGLSTYAIAARAYFYFTAATVDATTIGNFQASAGKSCAWSLSATGKLGIQESGSGVNIWTAAAVMNLNAFVRVEVLALANQTTPAASTLKIAYYLGDSTTAVDSYTPTAGTRNLIGPITSVGQGKFNASTYATSFWMDDLAVNDAATDYIGVNTPPTVTAGATQTVAAGAAFSLPWTATDADGNTLTYTATADAGNPSALGTLTVGGTAPNKTVTGTAPSTSGKYLVNVKANDGTVDSAVVPLTLYVTSTTSRALATGTTNWTPSAGTLAACLSDASQATYASSPSNPTGEDLPVTLSPFAPDATSCTIAYELSVDVASPTRTLTVTLKQGTTNIAAKTESTITTSVVAGSLALTAGQMAAWSSRNESTVVLTAS